MSPEPATETDPPQPPHCWLTTLELKPGMVIARPIQALQGGQEVLYIGAGGDISESTIAQLIVKGVECVAVVDDSTPDPNILATALDRQERRLHEIFGPAMNEDCQALFDALRLAGP